MRAISLIITALAGCAFANEAVIHGTQGLRLTCDSEAKLKFVSQFEHVAGFDFLKLAREPSVPVEVLVPADQLEAFKSTLTANRINYEVVIEDLNEVVEDHLAQQSIALLNRKKDGDILAAFPRYDEIQSYLKKLAKTRADIVRYFSIGKSYEGRDIFGVKISSGSGQSRPAVFIDAGIHAREWIAPTTAIYAIKQLVENATNHYLLENVDIYVVPLLNPDGYEYTHQTKQNRMWRKTRSINPDSRCVGTDGNRNFDYYWMTVGASSNPCSETFAGSKPFSEPETAALRDFLMAIKNFKVYLTFHSYGQYFLYPWSYTTVPPANEPELKCAGDKAELALSKIRGTRYTVGCSTVVYQPTAGSSDDWSMAIAGANLSYTVELPGGSWGFNAPPREIQPVGEETFEAVKVFIQYAEGKIC